MISPLTVGAASGDAPSGAYAEQHIELRLKRLAGAFDVANLAAGAEIGGKC